MTSKTFFVEAPEAVGWLVADRSLVDKLLAAKHVVPQLLHRRALHP